MNTENQDLHSAIQELTTETRRLRRTVLIGFAFVCFIFGLAVFSYGNYVVMAVCFVAAAMFLLWEPVARGPLGRVMKKLGKQIGEEVRRQHSPEPAADRGQDGTHPA